MLVWLVHLLNFSVILVMLLCLQESLAEYVIMWDDDIQPSATCLAAYVQAFKQHDKVRQPDQHL